MLSGPLVAVSAVALCAQPVIAKELLAGRGEINWRLGSERSILMSEIWAPLYQGYEGKDVLYADLRLMGDDKDNHEGNLGLGYRQIVDMPYMGAGVAGINGWFDRRLTDRGSDFHQITTGVEWLGEDMDIRLNGYIPLSNSKSYNVPNASAQGPALSGTGIVVDTNGVLLEEPQHGFDIEFGWELGAYSEFVKDHTDSLRVYGGAYSFNGDQSESVTGWRARIAIDLTRNVQIGSRFQRDDVRGSQGFLEATFRFPFGNKKSYRKHGLYARLDETPERDIDIVTADFLVDSGDRVPVINKETGEAQEVLVVDNQAAVGGDGSAENPYRELIDAQNMASEHTIIYVKTGDGMDSFQNAGITLSKTGQQLIGAGSDFVYDNGVFSTANGLSPTSYVIAAATGAPVISNQNADGDGVRVTADDVVVSGITVDGSMRDGIVVEAAGGDMSAQNVVIENVTTQNNRMGIYIHGTNSGAVSAKVEKAATINNTQHGIAVYDDTDAAFDVDLGGGAMGSAGNNILMGNTLEDLAVEYDGRVLSVQNNWWGLASGPDADDPGIGIAPQIYYGAPINDGLVGHWTLDDQWTTATTAYDRSGNEYDGTFAGGLSGNDTAVDGSQEGVSFSGGTDSIYLVASNTLLPGDTSFSMVSVFKTDQLFNTPGNLDYGGRLLSVYASNSGAQSTKISNFLYGDNSDSAGILYSSPFNRLFSTATNFDDEALHSLVSTYDSATNLTQVFFDDGATGAVDASTIRNSGTEPARIGVFSTTGLGAFTGDIYDTRIYNRVLTSDEVAELYRMDVSSGVNVSGFLSASP